MSLRKHSILNAKKTNSVNIKTSKNVINHETEMISAAGVLDNYFVSVGGLMPVSK